MSPPCQPFTRTGKQQDVADARSDALVHLCGLIGELEGVDAILMENVKGFETSRARDLYVKALGEAGYQYQEFVVSPSQLDVPNTRYRYYCLARKWAAFPWQTDGILERLPSSSNGTENATNPPYGRCVAHYLDAGAGADDDSALLLADDVLRKRGRVLDIADANAERTTCFTKAYTHYTEGTGSVYSPIARDRVTEAFVASAECADDDPERSLELLRALRLRYFSPDEVARLMCFQLARDRRRSEQEDDDAKSDGEKGGFSFPTATTKRQRYRLLGNSINVYVVSELLRLLFASIEKQDG